MLIPQLWKLDQTLARLRESAKIVYEELSGEDALHVHRYPDYVGTNYYFIPISIDEKYSNKLNKEKIAYKIREKGFSIVEGYHTPSTERMPLQRRGRDCPMRSTGSSIYQILRRPVSSPCGYPTQRC